MLSDDHQAVVVRMFSSVTWEFAKGYIPLASVLHFAAMATGL